MQFVALCSFLLYTLVGFLLAKVIQWALIVSKRDLMCIAFHTNLMTNLRTCMFSCSTYCK